MTATSSSKPILYMDPMCMNANSPWGLIVLSGLENEFELRHVLLGKQEQLAPDYVQKFPLHKVPALEHGDLLIDESKAVMCYIANLFPAQAGKFYPKDIKQRAIIDRAMDWRNTTFHPPLMRATYNKLWGVPGPQYTIEECVKYAVKEVNDALEYLATHLLKNRKFIAGDEPSLADIHIIPGMAYFIAFKGTTLEFNVPERIETYMKEFYEVCPEVLANQEQVQIPIMSTFHENFVKEFPKKTA